MYKFPLAKKHLGQNFLRNKHILSSIVGGDLAGKHILEVGPGPGDLTEAILSQKPSSLTLVEIDGDMIPLLQNRFPEARLRLFHGDVLKASIQCGEYVGGDGFILLDNAQPLLFPAYQVFGNIPYYITSPIILHFLYEVDFLPEKIVFTMQKEVADRIFARDGKHSVLSLACQLMADVVKVCDIHPQNFVPVPKVWSTCVAFTVRPGVDREKLKKVFQMVKVGFSQKRKKLLSNLSQKYSRDLLQSAFEANGIDENARAEDLTLDHWKALSSFLD